MKEQILRKLYLITQKCFISYGCFCQVIYSVSFYDIILYILPLKCDIYTCDR
jgi:hypothetical protein